MHCPHPFAEDDLLATLVWVDVRICGAGRVWIVEVRHVLAAVALVHDPDSLSVAVLVANDLPLPDIQPLVLLSVRTRTTGEARLYRLMCDDSLKSTPGSMLQPSAAELDEAEPSLLMLIHPQPSNPAPEGSATPAQALPDDLDLPSLDDQVLDADGPLTPDEQREVELATDPDNEPTYPSDTSGASARLATGPYRCQGRWAPNPSQILWIRDRRL